MFLVCIGTCAPFLRLTPVTPSSPCYSCKKLNCCHESWYFSVSIHCFSQYVVSHVLHLLDMLGSTPYTLDHLLADHHYVSLGFKPNNFQFQQTPLTYRSASNKLSAAYRIRTYDSNLTKEDDEPTRHYASCHKNQHSKKGGECFDTFN